MLQFRNRTGLAGTVFAAPDPDGVDTLYAVVKGTFDIATGRPTDEQIPVLMKDEFHGDPATSSIRLPSDVSLVKPATDVLLIGRAYAPGGSAYYVDVSLRVGPVGKVVRVFGDRVWQNAGAGLAPSAPQLFDTMPLVWERAFGGIDDGERGPEGDVRNPVGRGFRAAGSRKPIEGTPLPNLEDPAEPIGAPEQRPQPACFAPMCAHWEPRRSFAGTYDEAWQSGRAPYLPADFDARFFQMAPRGLVHQGFLQGGEPVEVQGASPDGLLRFTLPVAPVTVTYGVRGTPEPRPAHLDTVLIVPDVGRVVLVWRAALRCDKKLLHVDEVVTGLAAA